ncbi:MAG: glutathione S-transferase [Rhodocyclaceae bacterium]|nr:glutathione S-transferase [Rhodocyclaceae bacterium]
MQLIGMLDSPYVRRTAISLECLGLPFAHQPVSVFSTFDQFRGINPVVKAPTLVCDDGEVLMDSSLILQYAEARSGKSLWPQDAAELQHDLRAVGLALAACEKSVQIVYERNLRPQAFQYAPWLARVTGQLRAAYAGLEQDVGRRRAVFVGPLHQAAITAAVAWQFTQSLLAEVVAAAEHPALVELSAQLEKTPEFLKYPPTGPGVVAPAN